MSQTTWSAGKAFQYLCGVFNNVPAFKKLVENKTSDTISLSTRVDIECRPASFRSIRSGTAIAVLADEAAYWRSDESQNPDTEILNAARPLLATTGGPLIVISSPYARRGELWNTFKRDYGPDGDPLILVASAPSQTMNPTLSPKVVDRAFIRDPANAASEYGTPETGIAFRSDLESFIDRAVVDSCIIQERFEIPPSSVARYVGFVDPSGGSSDSFTLAIAHCEADTAILDVIREAKPPFSPEAVVAEFAKLLKQYHIFQVTGDRYAGEWPREQFRKHGVAYDTSEHVKSDIYRDTLPLLNAGRIELLDSPRMISQLCNLERRTARSGRDSIDHPPRGHDDMINAACGALLAASSRKTMHISAAIVERARTHGRYAYAMGGMSSRFRRFNRDAANVASITELLAHQNQGRN